MGKSIGEAEGVESSQFWFEASVNSALNVN